MSRFSMRSVLSGFVSGIEDDHAVASERGDEQARFAGDIERQRRIEKLSDQEGIGDIVHVEFVKAQQFDVAQPGREFSARLSAPPVSARI